MNMAVQWLCAQCHFGRRHRMWIGLYFLVMSMILGSCASARQAPQYIGAPPYGMLHSLTSLQHNGVRVTVVLERDRQGTLILAGRYMPEDPTYHLYSVHLPRAGFQGLGRPTLLEVPRQPGIEVLGIVGVDRAEIRQRVAALDIELPVYPDGAVTLRQPIQLAPARETRDVELRVTYMACSSDGYCLPPVENRAVVVTLPALLGD